MTQMDAQYPEYHEPHFEEEPRTSRLAITSLICSLIICCPIITAIGPVLGLIAMVRISSNRALRGTGIALAAIIIGVIVTALWGWLAIFSYQTFSVPIQEGPREAFRAGFDGNPDQFRDHMFDGAARASDEEVEAFIEELRSRYGDFVGFHVDQAELMARQDPLDFGDPIQTHPYVIEFENARVKADIDVTAVDPDTLQFFWEIRFGTIVIYDEDLGDLHFPPRPNSDE